ncbi:MAG TPA: histidine kinase [Ignavibacteria bacterium]|nr:histidine kinase [Ignavibacteria bacterium]
MKVSIDKKRIKFYLWTGLAYLLLWMLSELANNPETFFERAVNNTWRAGYIVVLNFILFEYTLPFISRKRRTILYNILAAIPIIFIHLMLYSWGLYAWRLIGIGLHIYTPLVSFGSTEHGVTEQMSYSMMSVFFFGIIRHIYNYIKLKQAAQQLQIEKQAAELNYLKSQTNPHFLFNTLNNIYSLARDKSDLVPESILRLSEILRFILYETGGDYIAIEQELKIITHYIALEKLRYDDSLRINFNYDIEDMKQALHPLLLIPLVENAFKHGVSETRNHPFIDIHLSVNKRQLDFLVKNSTEQFPGELSVKENIGLSNLRRQLELLYKDYNLSVRQDESVFTAALIINLSSRV